MNAGALGRVYNTLAGAIAPGDFAAFEHLIPTGHRRRFSL